MNLNLFTKGEYYEVHNTRLNVNNVSQYIAQSIAYKLKQEKIQVITSVVNKNHIAISVINGTESQIKRIINKVYSGGKIMINSIDPLVKLPKDIKKVFDKSLSADPFDLQPKIINIKLDDLDTACNINNRKILWSLYHRFSGVKCFYNNGRMYIWIEKDKLDTIKNNITNGQLNLRFVNQNSQKTCDYNGKPLGVSEEILLKNSLENQVISNVYINDEVVIISLTPEAMETYGILLKTNHHYTACWEMDGKVLYTFLLVPNTLSKEMAVTKCDNISEAKKVMNAIAYPLEKLEFKKSEEKFWNFWLWLCLLCLVIFVIVERRWKFKIISIMAAGCNFYFNGNFFGSAIMAAVFYILGLLEKQSVFHNFAYNMVGAGGLVLTGIMLRFLAHYELLVDLLIFSHSLIVSAALAMIFGLIIFMFKEKS